MSNKEYWRRQDTLAATVFSVTVAISVAVFAVLATEAIDIAINWPYTHFSDRYKLIIGVAVGSAVGVTSAVLTHRRRSRSYDD